MSLSRATRGWMLLVAFIVTFSFSTFAPVFYPSPALAQDQPGAGQGQPQNEDPTPPLICKVLPDGAIRDGCNQIDDKVEGAIHSVVSEGVGGVANAVVEPLIHEVAVLETSAMTWVLKQEYDYINDSTSPSLTFGWYKRQMAVIVFFGMVFALAMVAIRSTDAIRQEEYGEIGSTFAMFVVYMYGSTMMAAIVGGLVFICDDVLAPQMVHLAIGDLSHTLTNTLDFQKELSSTNNVVAPIILPALYGLLGFVGGAFTKLMFEFREFMLYLVTAGEVLALALAVGGRFGNDMFVRTSMTLIALILFKVAMAFMLVVGVQLIGSTNGSAVLTGAVILLGLPVFGWMFYKRVSGHNIQVMGGVFNAHRAYSLLKPA
jgi:hypothetical protein